MLFSQLILVLRWQGSVPLDLRKNATMKKLPLLILLSVLFAFSSTAQLGGDPASTGVFGAGIRSGIFQLVDLNSGGFGYMPSNRLVLNYDPLSNLRIEFQGGLSQSVENDWTPDNQDAKAVTSVYILGLHYVRAVADCKLSAGFRYGTYKHSEDDFEYNPNTFEYDKKEDVLTGSFISPVIGGEYFFSKHFSLGAEFSFLIGSSTTDYGREGEVSTNASMQKTETALAFRFYPF
ncbi:MAG: hypothetical protein RL021_2250 [Bacteroidota bacterium]|jgi:hypothetical protein